ncbi:MAG: membrane protein insertase YidC [Leptonema sp. (in: Bacteria)]|nr:membrane protein insertase YidC [Leptonema sp. (in: bacteria)]
MNQDKQSSITSFLPILILGIAAIAVMQVLNPPEEQSKKPTIEAEQKQEQTIDKTPLSPIKNEFKAADFVFKNEGVAKEILYDAGPNIFVLNTEGGRIERVYVKSRPTVPIPDTVIDKTEDATSEKYRALEITMGNGMEFQPHLYFKDQGANQLAHPLLNSAIFKLQESNDGDNVKEFKFSLPVTFKGHRLEIIKVFRFLKNENFFHQITSIKNLESIPFQLNGDLYFKPFSGIGPGPIDDSSREMTYFGRFVRYDDSLSRLPSYGSGGSGWFGCGGGDKGPYTLYLNKPGSVEYVGAHSRYFIAYARFLSSNKEEHHSSLDGLIVTNNPSLESNAFYTGVIRGFKLSSNDTLTVRTQVFAGLRADEQHVFNDSKLGLDEFGEDRPDSGLRDVIYSSTFLTLFSSIRDAIIWLLRYVESYVGNYGFAIILIGVGLKLATYPLNQMQAKTMKKMSALKPEMDIINEKYKDDPNEKQKRIMEIYKKHKINPAKGCLPVLIQIPIFIALYSAFSESIELWGSPFIWWMTDLSAPDTIYTINAWIFHGYTINILPLIMVVSQFAQQRLTTVSSDPQQKMLMYVMPFIMIFFFWSMPSGVTLYWTVQNIISVIWQLAANRFVKVED